MSPRKRTGENRTCEICGTEFYVPRWHLEDKRSTTGRFCSLACKASAQTGVEHRLGTRYVRKDGYISVKVGIRQYELEHRLVMSQHLGRELGADEHVHHLNGDKTDNRLDNLQVVSNADHQRLHGDRPIFRRSRVELTCERCGMTYEKKSSRAAESRFCSNTCRLDALHESRRKT